MWINLGWIYFGLLVALISVTIAYLNYKRTNSTQIRILKVDSAGCQSVSENNGELFHYFKLTLQNLGLPLISPQIKINFKRDGYMGWVTFELKPPYNKAENVTFAKGWIARFELKSFQLNEYYFSAFADLEDTSRQEAQFEIYSQGFLVCEIPIGGFWNRAKTRWNRFAAYINGMFEGYVVAKDGRKLASHPKVIPTFIDLSFELLSFTFGCQSIGKSEEERKAIREKEVAILFPEHLPWPGMILSILLTSLFVLMVLSAI